MSCGDSKAHNANAQSVSDSVKAVNVASHAAGLTADARVTTKDGSDTFHAHVAMWKGDNPRPKGQTAVDYQQEAEAAARRELPSALEHLARERVAVAAANRHRTEAEAMTADDLQEELYGMENMHESFQADWESLDYDSDYNPMDRAAAADIERRQGEFKIQNEIYQQVLDEKRASN